MNTQATPSPRRHGVVAAILIDAALSVFVLLARNSAPHALTPAELLGSLAIAVAYGTPAITATVARHGRPSLFVAAALLATALSITAFSLITLVLLPPALLFLGAAAGGPRAGWTAAIAAILVLPVIVVALASGLFAVAWVVPIGVAVSALVLLARHASAAGGGTAAARVLGGTVLVAGLASLAWLLPLANTTTICWSSNGGSVTQTAEPDAAAGSGQISVGSAGVAPGGSAGCDGGVPAIEASALSLALSGACALTALVVIPRSPAAADA